MYLSHFRKIYFGLQLKGNFMSTQTITLQVPDVTYQHAYRVAKVQQRSLEEVLVNTLTVTFPPLDDVPAEMEAEVAGMAYLSNEILKLIAHATMTALDQKRLDALLYTQNRGELTPSGEQELAALMAQYGRTMLQRAKAVALLSARGISVSSLYHSS